MSLFIAQLTTILMLIRTVIVITWEITWFTFAAGTDLCEWVQVGIYKYISLIVNIRSSLIPWFSVSFAGAIAQRNLFIRLYQQNKSSVSKLKFKHASNRCKNFLKLPNLLMLIKQKRLLLPKNLALSKYVIPSLFNVPKVFSFDQLKSYGIWFKSSFLSNSGFERFWMGFLRKDKGGSLKLHSWSYTFPSIHQWSYGWYYAWCCYQCCWSYPLLLVRSGNWIVSTTRVSFWT